MLPRRSLSVPPYHALAMRTLITLGCLLTLVLSGCSRSTDDANAPTPRRTAPPAATTTHEPGIPEGGRLVFEDRFDGESFDERWTTASPRWRLADGRLQVQGARNEGFWLQVPLPEQVKITYETTSHSPDGDLKFEVFTDGRTHESGYVGIFGGWQNRLNIIARLDEHGDDRLVGQPGVRVVPEQRYTFTIVRTDQRLRWYIDGEHFLTWDDSAALRGPGHAYFGFNNWDVPTSFHSIRVYDLAPDGP